ncbi:hypothetical protein ACH4C6_22610 [Streptomyces sp. NPDC017943]|uniref:hypothetical protein n=1 Tax=Streptomyces sp. NPDC017943 TaxID=3365019 RepID=UPI00378E5F28
MEAVIAVFALLFVLLVALGAYATVKAVGAAKRSVDRGISQARRTVEDHTLRAKSLAQTGAAGELAQLRLKLRTSMRATQDALNAAATDDESVKESFGLFQRLGVHGHELDGELKRLESEPDRATLRERLPELRERTERITQSADALRWAVRDRAHRFSGDDLDTLSAQIDVEAGALRHWTAAQAPPAAPAPQGASGTGRAGETSAAGQTRPGTTRSGAEQEPGARPAITAPAPRPTYPWQKKPRPESTT